MFDEPLLSALRGYTPATPQEADEHGRVLALAHSTLAWDRARALHLTASALVLHPPSRRVLLRWHARQQAWLQVGGHADPGENDPLAVARREGAEETGLEDLTPWPGPALQHLAIVPVPANDREAAHEHADLRFFLATHTPEAVKQEDAIAELRWLTPDDALSLTTEENVRETIRRASNAMGASRRSVEGSAP